jgi:hypothetical protein
MTQKQRETLTPAERRNALLTEQAIKNLNHTTTEAGRRQIIAALPKAVLPAVATHFAGYGSEFPVGRAVVGLIERRIGKVQADT